MNAPLVQRIAAILVRPTVAKVMVAYLFGSHASGRQHLESDVDIGVLLPWVVGEGTRERFEIRIRLAGLLQAELQAGAVDLVVLNDAPPTLVRHITTEGILVYCTDPEVEHALRRDAMLRAADLEPFLARTRRLKLDGMQP
jgi:predicted nucleotidyltransferase